eukprot:1171228-Alexandrium_andersonii.AAC.1
MCTNLQKYVARTPSRKCPYTPTHQRRSFRATPAAFSIDAATEAQCQNGTGAARGAAPPARPSRHNF